MGIASDYENASRSEQKAYDDEVALRDMHKFKRASTTLIANASAPIMDYKSSKARGRFGAPGR